jgi:hypothetical protein
LNKKQRVRFGNPKHFLFFDAFVFVTSLTRKQHQARARHIFTPSRDAKKRVALFVRRFEKEADERAEYPSARQHE